MGLATFVFYLKKHTLSKKMTNIIVIDLET